MSVGIAWLYVRYGGLVWMQAAFYGVGADATAHQLVDFVAGKVLDAVGVRHTLLRRWTGRSGLLGTG